MSTTHSPDPLRSRRRLAEEWLMESSNWRGNLNDAESQRLMNRAQDYVNNTITDTAVFSDDEAEEIIDSAVTAVLRVMRDINKLTPIFNQLDEESAQQQLQKFSSHLQNIDLPPIQENQIRQILDQRQSWDAQITFTNLYQMLTPTLQTKNTEEEE